MSWSIRIGRFLGIDVFVHATFLLLLAAVVIASYWQTRSWEVTLDQLIFMVLLFTIVVLHEYGHALMARVFGVPTRDITLLPIGGVARLERIPENPMQELLIAIAGPAVNVVLALLCWIWVIADGTLATSLNQVADAEVSRDLVRPLTASSLSVRLLGVNVALFLFNLIPAFPMDGGRVLRALLATQLDYVRATQIAAVVGQLFALAFGFFGLVTGHFMFLFIAFFVWVGAGQEAQSAAQRSLLAGVRARQAMITKFDIVTPGDTLDRVASHVLAGFQHDFPVLEGNRVVGLITRSDLLKALAEHGWQRNVASVMTTDFLSAKPDEPLESIVSRLQTCACHSLPVLDGDRLVGIITSENIGEYMMLRSAAETAGRVAGGTPAT